MAWRAGRVGRRRPRHSGLPATAQHVSPGAWLCGQESQCHLGEEGEGRGARGRGARLGWGRGAPGRAAVCARGGGAGGGRGTPSPSAGGEAPAGSASTCRGVAFPLSINIYLPAPGASAPLSESTPTLPPWFPLPSVSPSSPPPPSAGEAGRLPGFSRCCLAPTFSTAV